MTRPGEKNISAYINPNISERFSKQTDDRGQIKYRSIESAIRLWINLPTELQSIIIESSDDEIKDIYESLGDRLREGLRRIVIHEKQKRKRKSEGGSKGSKSPI